MICCLSWSKRSGSLMSVMIWMNLKTWRTTWMNLKILRNGNLNCVWTGAFFITSVTVTFVKPDLSLFSVEYCRYFSVASICVFPNSLFTDCISLLIQYGPETLQQSPGIPPVRSVWMLHVPLPVSDAVRCTLWSLSSFSRYSPAK